MDVKKSIIHPGAHLEYWKVLFFSYTNRHKVREKKCGVLWSKDTMQTACTWILKKDNLARLCGIFVTIESNTDIKNKYFWLYFYCLYFTGCIFPYAEE